MSNQFNYPVKLTKQKEGGYLVQFPDLPEAITQGENTEDALAMREKKLSNTTLAKKLDCDEKEVRRLLDPHYNSKLPRIEQALHILGKKLQLEIVSF